jgi:glycosyltransferase involved in cell wall biosynthesis
MDDTQFPVDVSVILPCYNEAKILRTSVEAVMVVMEQTKYRYEIIIAEDASRDGTAAIAKMLSEEFPNIVWIHREERRGRGSAVANAIVQSRGSICGYLDADLETPAHYIPAFVSAI